MKSPSLEKAKEAKDCCDYALSEKLIVEFLAQSEPDSAAWGLLGTVLSEQCKYDEAERAFARAEQIDPNNVAILANWGTLCAKRGLDLRAAEYYRKALALDVRVELLVLLGTCERRLGDTHAAMGHFHEATDLDGSYSEAWANLGNVYEELENFEKAIEAYRVAIRCDSRCTSSLERLGILLMTEHQNQDEATQLLERCVAIDKTRGWAHLYLGLIHEQCGRVEFARELIQKAVAISPSDGRLLMLFAEFVLRHDGIDSARSVFHRAIAASPDDGQVIADFKRFEYFADDV